VVLGVVCLLIVFVVARDMKLRPENTKTEKPDGVEVEKSVTPTQSKTPIKGALDEIDRLADSGAYSEAVQLLLKLSIGKIQAQFSQASLLSMTSREILREVNLPEQAKKSFSTIVTAEELGHFGGRQTNRKVFQICRDNYQTFEDTARGTNLA